MGVSKYAYVYARIRARMCELLGERKLKELVDARSTDFLPLLMDSAYKEKLTKEGLVAVNASRIENALNEELIDQYMMVIRSTDGVIRDFFVELLRQLEVKNLKAVIRAKATGNTAPATFFPVEKFFRRHISKLTETDSLESLIKRLDNPYRQVLDELLPEYEKSKRLFVLENALDAELFGAIWHKTERLRAVDKGIVRNIIGTEFDIVNVMTLLRCKSGGIAEAELTKYFLPYAYTLDFDAVNDSIYAENMNSAIQLLPTPAYKDVLSDAYSAYEAEGSLVPFENALRHYFFMLVKNTLRGYPINIGAAIGYLYLKELEIKNLSTIAVCKENDLSAEATLKIVMM